MNEKKKALVSLGVLAFLLVVIIVVVIMSLIQSNKKLQEIKDVMDSENPQIIYLSKPTCYYCNLIEPITTSLEEEFNLTYFHINTGELSNSELIKTLEIIGINSDTFGTPYIAIVQNGKIIGEQVGYTDENVLFDLFKTHHLIDENASLHMNYIDDLDTIWNDEESKLVLIGESGDTASIEARITMRKLASSYSFEINYFDTAKLEDSTEYNELLEDLDIKQLPILAIVQNGSVIASTIETSQENYEKFLKENDYIK